MNWLKHGNGKMYSRLKFSDLEKRKIGDIQYFPNVERAYFCIETEYMNLIILIKFSNLKIGIIDYSANLNFWDWIDDHGKIHGILKELQYFYKTLSNSSEGRLITKKQLSEIYSYNFFPREIIENYRNDGRYWFEELGWKNAYCDKFEWFINLKKDYKKYYLEKENID